MPDIEDYRPHISDPVKNTATGDKNLAEFLQLYLSSALKYPSCYMKALLNLDAGYLCLGYTMDGYLNTYVTPGFGVYRNSLFPMLEKICEQLYTGDSQQSNYQSVIGLNFLCKPSLYFWLIVAAIFSLVKNSFKKTLPVTLFIGVFMLTLLAGPCVMVRYALPYIVCIPSAFFYAYFTKNNNCEIPSSEGIDLLHSYS